MSVQSCLKCGRRCGPAVRRCPDCGSDWFAPYSPQQPSDTTRLLDPPIPVAAPGPDPTLTLPPQPDPTLIGIPSHDRRGGDWKPFVLVAGVLGFALGGGAVWLGYSARGGPPPAPATSPGWTAPPVGPAHTLPSPPAPLDPAPAPAPPRPYEVSIRSRPAPMPPAEPGAPSSPETGSTALPQQPATSGAGGGGPASVRVPGPEQPIPTAPADQPAGEALRPLPDDATAVLTVRNTTNSVVEVRLSGPAEQNVTAAPNSVVPFRLPPGTYRAVGTAGGISAPEASVALRAARAYTVTIQLRTVDGNNVLALETSGANE